MKLLSGEKTFEYRVNDFECEPGDVLVLEEYVYTKGQGTTEGRRPTGRENRKQEHKFLFFVFRKIAGGR